MLTIRKQNFDQQYCYCCHGDIKNICDPNSSVVYRLNHKLPDSSRHIQAQVVVPRCNFCADKMKPVFPIAIWGGIIGAIAGFMYAYSTNGIFISIICAVIWAIGSAVATLVVTNFSFSVVYNQMESDYEIVNILQNKYGWQTDEPKQGDTDKSFTEEKMNEMLNDLVENYNCEYGDV